MAPRTESRRSSSMFRPMDDDFVSVKAKLAVVMDEEIRAKIPRKFGEQMVKPLNFCSKSPSSSGDVILKSMRESMYNGYFGIVPTPDQKDIIEQILGGGLAILYGEELPMRYDSLMEENPHWTNISSVVAIVHARREGKSMAVALISAAFAIFVPNMVTAIFSTGIRASRNILMQTYKLIMDYFNNTKNMEGKRDFIDRFNAENLWMKFNEEDPMDISKINSLPSKIDNNPFDFPFFFYYYYALFSFLSFFFLLYYYFLLNPHSIRVQNRNRDGWMGEEREDFKKKKKKLERGNPIFSTFFYFFLNKQGATNNILRGRRPCNRTGAGKLFRSTLE